MKGPPLPALRASTVTEMLQRAATSDGGVILIDAQEQERRFSWGELLERARIVAAALQARGVGEGERIALIFPTGLDFIEAFFGAQLAGAVPVPLYPPVRLGRLDEYHPSTTRMLRACGASMVLADAQVLLLLGASIEAARPAHGCLTLSLLGRRERNVVKPAASPEGLALIQFSSGSTVDPKPVALTHRNLISQCAALQERAPGPKDEGSTGVSWLPLYHDMGLVGCLVAAAYYPGWIALIPPESFLVRPALWLRAISRHRGFISPAPNFAYGLCLKRVKDQELEGVDLSCWRYALNGAEPVHAPTLDAFARRFARWGFREEALLPVYGLSEATLAVTFAPVRDRPRALDVDAQTLATEGRVQAGSRRIVSVGTPVAGVELELQDEEGRALPDRTVGRVMVKGPSVMRAYFDSAAEQVTAREDRWLDTGDLGFIADGELFISGRAKDLVIIRGANHSPQTFEDALLSLDGVRTGCAVALGFTPEGEPDEALLILAERSGESNDDAAMVERIRAAILSACGIRAHTIRMLSPGTLPRTSSGKLRRREAFRQYVSGTLKPPKNLSAFGVAREIAKSVIAHRRARVEE